MAAVNVDKPAGQQLSEDLIGGNQVTLDQYGGKGEEQLNAQRLSEGKATAKQLDPNAPSASQGFAGQTKSTDAGQQPAPAQPQKLQTLIASPEEAVTPQKDIMGVERPQVLQTAKGLQAPDTALSLRDTPKFTGVKLQQAQAEAQPVPADQYDTKLPADKELQFQAWKAMHAPNDSGRDYDLRGAFAAGVKPETSGPDKGHFPDTFKKPNHPTFSNESKYATGENAAKAGHWEGDKFVPPGSKEAGDAFGKGERITGPTSPSDKFDKVTGSGKDAPAAATAPLTKAQAYQTAVEAARAANIKDPYTAAAIAMKESGWMQKGTNSVFNRTGGTNPFGQTGNRNALGTVKGADKQEHAVYRNLGDAFKTHFERWGETYRDSPRETLQNMVQRGYNRTDPNWVKDILAIRSRMSTALER